MAELADAPDLGSGGFTVQVQVLSPAPNKKTVSFERFSYLVCAVFLLVPDWDGRFALQNRKMTRTLLLRFVAVCRLLRAVFLSGLRRFPARPGLGQTFCSAKPKNDAHPASQICHSHCDYIVSLLFIAHLWLFLYCNSLLKQKISF